MTAVEPLFLRVYVRARERGGRVLEIYVDFRPVVYTDFIALVHIFSSSLSQGNIHVYPAVFH